MGKTVTSLKIDEDIWKQVKIKCIEKDIELGLALDQALREWIKRK